MRLNSQYALINTVRAAREAAGMTQQEVADKSGMSRVWLARLERGDANVKLDSFLRVAAVLGITLEATWDPDDSSKGDRPESAHRPVRAKRLAARSTKSDLRRSPSMRFWRE